MLLNYPLIKLKTKDKKINRVQFERIQSARRKRAPQIENPAEKKVFLLEFDALVALKTF